LGCAHFSISDRYLLNSSADSIIRSLDAGPAAFVPNNIRSLGPSCFQQIEIEELIFEPVSIVSMIGDAALSRTKLRSVCIPRSVECLSKDAFAQCSCLTIVTFETDSRLSVMGISAFEACSRLPAICLPRSVKIVCQSCFDHCAALSSVTFESDSELLTIEADAFCDCGALKSISLPASLEFLTSPFTRSGISAIEIDPGNRHLSVCEPFLLDFTGERIIEVYGSPDTVQIPRTAKVLGASAFRGSHSLTAICIPASVSTIAARCFSGSRLSSVTFEAGSKLAVIEREAFACCKALTSFHVPRFVGTIDGSAFISTEALNITVDLNNQRFWFSRPFLLTNAVGAEGLAIVRYFGLGKDVTIPKGVQRLGRCSLQSCYCVRRVFFDSKAELSRIDESAFQGTGLETISIPPSVAAIGEKCFAQCTALRVVAFAAGSKLSDIGSDVFQMSDGLARIEIPGAILPVCGRGFPSQLKRGLVKIKI
jgi:hypothetical protein